jgi:hypothetical protein
VPTANVPTANKKKQERQDIPIHPTVTHACWQQMTMTADDNMRRQPDDARVKASSGTWYVFFFMECLFKLTNYYY